VGHSQDRPAQRAIGTSHDRLRWSPGRRTPAFHRIATRHSRPGLLTARLRVSWPPACGSR